jgi:outer membrane protein assembly factor BamB
MEGRVLHRWRRAVHQVWPSYPRAWIPATAEFWRRAHLFENGDLLAIFENLGMVKLNRNSEVIWARPGREHHDLEVLANGDIYVLTSEAHLVKRVDPLRPLREDFITVLDSNGREKRHVSLLEAFESSRFAHIWEETEQKWGDSFHTNTLEVLDGRLAQRIPEFKRGHVLISVLKLDTIAVVDLEQRRVVWAQRGEFKRQHDPKVLPNGNLLLFDNQGGGTHSRVIELDPASGASAWEYAGSPAEPFFSAQCGTAQRLANGNTLVTESDNGRAFEVTAAGEIVWEFYNPHRAGEEGQYIATLFELLRLPPDFPIDWSRAASSG